LPPGGGHGIAKELTMAGRKRDPSVSAPDGARAFTVVLEQLHGEFRVFGEALGGLRQHMNDRFDAVDRRFERVEHELGEVKRDLVEVKRDLVQVKQDLGDVQRDLADVQRDLGEVQRDLADVKVDLGLVKSAATTHSRELREIRAALGNKVERGEVEAIATHVVARDAQR
jgi:septal ring factor EnvC (AmiA/AmiB activator)